MYKLKSNIESYYTGKSYGFAGEDVKLIKSNDDGMSLVENKNGIKYYTSFNNLTTEAILTQHMPVQDTTGNITNRASVSKTKKAKPINNNTQTLF